MKKLQKISDNEKVILSDPYSVESARTLNSSLSNLGMNLKVTCREERLSTLPLIRYGNSSELNLPGAESSMNHPKIIRLCSGKSRFSKVLYDGGIESVPIFERLVSKSDIPNNIFPILVRETLSSSGGRGIHVAKTTDELIPFENRGFYWTKFVNMEFELRLHILGGQIVKIFKKVIEPGRTEEEFPIRNNDRGYHFSIKKVESYPKLVPVISKIHECMPVRQYFMALDVGWDSKKKEYFILEGNSAPGLNESTADLYAQYIYNCLKGE